jgi:hypothetical protein
MGDFVTEVLFSVKRVTLPTEDLHVFQTHLEYPQKQDERWGEPPCHFQGGTYGCTCIQRLKW